MNMNLEGASLKFGKPEKYRVRFDLVDCEIDICSPEIMRHFTDSFSCGSLRDEFTNNLIESEIVSDEIYMFEAK